MRWFALARLMGGDGRCSCSFGNPSGCGAPPPDFDKTAHTGAMILARADAWYEKHLSDGEVHSWDADDPELLDPAKAREMLTEVPAAS